MSEQNIDIEKHFDQLTLVVQLETIMDILRPLKAEAERISNELKLYQKPDNEEPND